MSVWVVAKMGKDLTVGQSVRITYPNKLERDVIYYQGRSVPTLGKTGMRYLGLLTRLEHFDAIGLVACEVQLLGRVHDTFNGQQWKVLYEHNRPP